MSFLILSKYEHSSNDSLVVRDVYEVFADIEIRIEEFKRGLFVHSSHTIFLPLITDAHGTKTNRGDMETGNWR